MEEESDDGLFVYLAFIDTEPADGNRALAELMRRYEAIVSRRCQNLCRRYPTLGLSGDDLVNLTFLKAVDRAETYRAIDNPNATIDECRRYTIAWLFTIARNLLWDRGRNTLAPLPFASVDPEPEALSSNDIAALVVASKPDLYSSANVRDIALAFEELPEQSQVVLLWTLDRRKFSPSGAYMRRGSVADLADRLETTDANVRKIRQRAFERIKQAVFGNKPSGSIVR